MHYGFHRKNQSSSVCSSVNPRANRVLDRKGLPFPVCFTVMTTVELNVWDRKTMFLKAMTPYDQAHAEK